MRAIITVTAFITVSLMALESEFCASLVADKQVQSMRCTCISARS